MKASTAMSDGRDPRNIQVRYVFRHVLWATLWIALGITTLRILADSTPWITAGLTAMFLGKASFSVFQLIGDLRGQTRRISLTSGLKAMAVGYLLYGCLLGLGALQQRSWLGLFVGYGAFSFAWMWLWI